MKPILLFIRTTLTGGIIFLLPVIVVLVVLTKAFNILTQISAPISDQLPVLILGMNGSRLLVISLLIVICFFSGLLFYAQWVRRWVAQLEENILVYMPGYSLMKALTADTIGEEVEHNMTPILIEEDNSWGLAFLVEEGENLSTVFIPDAPRHDAGEIKIIPNQLVRKLDVSVSKFSQSIKTFGKGAIHWVKDQQ